VKGHPPHQVGVLDSPVVVLIRDDVGALVGIHAQVEELRNAQALEGFVPDGEASGRLHLAEHGLPVPVPVGDQHAVVVEVGEVGALALRLLAKEVRKLVVAVEMHLEVLASSPENISVEVCPALI
jgi:hypothetical protein